VTWSATDGLKLYVNGMEVADDVPSTPAMAHRVTHDVGNPDVPHDLILGSARQGATYCWTAQIAMGAFEGDLDETRVWPIALGPNDVALEAQR